MTRSRTEPDTWNMTKTHIIRGQKVRQSSQRRFIVVACRPEPVEGRYWDHRLTTEVTREDGTTYTQSGGYVATTFAARPAFVVGRSDSLATAKARARKHGCDVGAWIVVFDTVEEREVA